MLFKEANLELERYPSSLAFTFPDELLSYYCGFLNKEIFYPYWRGMRQIKTTEAKFTYIFSEEY